MGYLVVGLDGEAEQSLDAVAADNKDRAIALVLGAEGPGLRQRTKETVDMLVKIPFSREFGSLNVSNAAAVALYAVQNR
jgi:23S rRNA (guanosine2251-2'-O)-methyltransferase